MRRISDRSFKRVHFKRNALLAIFLLIGLLNAAGQSITGAAIGYKNDSAGTYSVYVKYYYPCNQRPSGDSLVLNVSSSSFSDSVYLQIKDSGMANPYCSDTFSCSGSNKFLYKFRLYSATIDLDASPYSSSDKINFTCALIHSQDTFYQPSNCSVVQFRLSAFLDRSLGENSNTGGLYTPPLFTTLLNSRQYYAIGYSDVTDRDSLDYKVQPLGGGTSPCYRFFQVASPGMYLDAETGQMVFTTNGSEDKVAWEYFVRDLRKDSSNNVVVAGSTNVQMITMVLEDSTNSAPELNGPYFYSTCAGSDIEFLITSDDNQVSGISDTLSVTWDNAIPEASFEIKDSSARLKSAWFKWKPALKDVSTLPFYFRVEVNDNHCPVGSVNSLMYGVLVKAPPLPVLSMDSLGCNRYAFEVSDTGSSQTYYTVSVLDSNGNLAQNVHFSRSGTITTAFPLDTVQFRGNGDFVIRVYATNQSGCSTLIYDTIHVEGAFNFKITESYGTICAPIDSLFAVIDSLGHQSFKLSWNQSFTDTLVYFPLAIHSSTTGYIDVSLRITDELGCVTEQKRMLYIYGFQKLDTSNAIRLSCNKKYHTLSTRLDPVTRPFHWTTGDTTQTINVLDGGMYRIYTRTDSGCYFSDSILLDPTPIPTISVSDKDSVCLNDTLFANIREGGVYQNIEWNTGSLKRFTLPDNKSQYWVKVTATSSCVFADTVTGLYHFIPIKTSILSDTTVSCDGDSVLISSLQPGVVGVDILWNTGDTTDKINVATKGKYFYKVTDGNCTATDTTILVHVTSPNAALPDTIEVCPDYPTILTAPVNSGLRLSYYWNGVKGVKQYKVDTQSTVHLRIIKAGKCMDQDSATVLHHPLISNGFVQSRDTLCTGDTLVLNPGIRIAGYSILWNSGDTSDEVPVYADGSFSCEIVDRNGCVFRDTISIEEHSKPSNVNLGDDRVICDYSNLVLTVAPEHDDKKFIWSDSSTGKELTTNKSGIYWVQVINDKGCWTKDSMSLVKKSPLPYLKLQSAQLCYGDTIHLDLTSADSVVWNLPDTTVVDTNYLVLSYLNEGRTDYVVVDTTLGVKCQRSGTFTIKYSGAGQIFGKVLNNSLTPLKDQKVQLVRINNDKVEVIDELTTDKNGDYSFRTGCPDSVVVRGLTDNEEFKGYSPKGVDINRSKLVNIGPGDVIVQQVILQTRPQPGPGKVSGLVKDSVTDLLIDGLEVILVDDASEKPFAIDTTVNGRFTFNNVPYGNYAVFIDEWGFENRTNDRIPVNMFTSDYDTLNFIYSGRQIHLLNVLNIKEETFRSFGLVYPNPASDILYIESTGETTGIRIISSDGSVMIDDLMRSKMYELSVAEWSSGVYFVQLISGSGESSISRLMIVRN